MKLEEIKKLHDKAYESGQDVREKAMHDTRFAWFSQWDDDFFDEVSLQYRGQFDICRKGLRKGLTDLKANPVQVDFRPTDETDDSAADLLDGLYRADSRNNVAQEAADNANQEMVVCGFGAWELVTEYKTKKGGDTRQVIRRKPIYEAVSKVFWDPNAVLKDKSDADYVSVLARYSEDGYKKLVKKLTGREPDNLSPFAEPDTNYKFPWTSATKTIHVVRFYHREEKDVTFYTHQDMYGSEKTCAEHELKEVEDELVDGGYELIGTKKINVPVITRYVASGTEILDVQRIPGRHLPVIPQYGERAYVDGEEHYEGIIRLAKDPQQLRNFQLSYLADTVSQSPREKPIFTAEQVAGFEDMLSLSGPDNDYPYIKINAKDMEGNPLPNGPIGYLKSPDVPPALMASIEQSRMAVDDVAGAGLPADIFDTDLSGKAIQTLQKRLDMQSYTYQENHKHAMRRDGEVYASMASEVYDYEDQVSLIKPDGSEVKEQINAMEVDYATMTRKIKNDIPSMTFEVYADIGPAYESVKEQNKEELKELINGLPPNTPHHELLLNQYLQLLDGVRFEGLRDYSRMNLIRMGVMKPETEEEIQMFEQMQQQQQDDPLIMEGQARMMEGQAALQDKVNDANAIAVQQFNAETQRQKVQIQAAEAGVKIRDLQASTQGKQIDNTLKLRGAVGF